MAFKDCPGIRRGDPRGIESNSLGKEEQEEKGLPTQHPERILHFGK